MTEEIKKLMKKAEHVLEVADRLMDDGYPIDAFSKFYYSIYYEAQALLKSEGIDVINHSAVESDLGYYFAKSTKLDPKYLTMFIDAEKSGEMADYDVQEEIVEPVDSLKVEKGNAFSLLLNIFSKWEGAPIILPCNL